MRKQRKRTTLEVTRGEIILALIMAVVALTAAYEIGVSSGKKKVIKAEKEATQRNDIPLRSTIPALDEEEPSAIPILDEEEPSAGSPSDQAAEAPKPAQQNETSVRAPSQIPTGGEFSAIPPQDQPAAQPQADGKAAQYTVQVGTFGSHQNAEDLVALLKSYEYKSWLKPEPSGEKMLYSVFVGGFITKDEAKQFGDLLQARLSFVKSYMIREMQE